MLPMLWCVHDNVCIDNETMHYESSCHPIIHREGLPLFFAPEHAGSSVSPSTKTPALRSSRIASFPAATPGRSRSVSCSWYTSR